MKKEVICTFISALLMRRWDKKMINSINSRKLLIQTQRDILDHWLTMKEKNVSIELYLEKHNYRRIAIYGMSMLGNHLYEELIKCKNVTRLIGIEKKDVQDNYKIEIKKPDMELKDIDVVIITAMTGYDSIVNNIKKAYFGEIVSLQQVINECENYYTYEI